MFTISGTAISQTLLQWCRRTRDEYLAPQGRDELDRLDGDIADDDEILATQYEPTGLRAGTRLEIDGELMHVWARNNPNGYDVQRGFLETTAAAHVDGTIVVVNPRWPLIDLARGLQREIRSWPVAVVAVAAGTFSVAASAETIPLTGLESVEVQRLFRVQRPHHRTSDTSWPVIDANLEYAQDPDSFGTVPVLRLSQCRDAGDVRVIVGYQHPTVDDGDLDFTDDIGTTNHLTKGLADAAMLGVAGRLLLAQEVARTDDRSQTRPRRGEDVPPGHQMQAGEALLRERDRLLKMEVERLTSRYGMRTA